MDPFFVLDLELRHLRNFKECDVSGRPTSTDSTLRQDNPSSIDHIVQIINLKPINSFVKTELFTAGRSRAKNAGARLFSRSLI